MSYCTSWNIVFGNSNFSMSRLFFSAEIENSIKWSVHSDTISVNSTMSVEKEECELEQLVSSDEEHRVTDNAHNSPSATPKPPPRTHSYTDSRTKTSCSTSNKVKKKKKRWNCINLSISWRMTLKNFSHFQSEVKRMSVINCQALRRYTKINHKPNRPVWHLIKYLLIAYITIALTSFWL